MKFATAYNGSNLKVVEFNDQPSLCKQSFKDECNINTILKKYEKTGLVSHSTSANAIFDDFSSCDDYQSSLNNVIQAQSMFDSLPSGIRKRFANNPALFMDFVHDPSNLDEMVRLGLAERVELRAEPIGSSGEATKPSTP